MKVSEIIIETASSGTTSAGSIATLVSPNLALGDKAARKRYGKGGSPNPPKAKQAKNSDGTAKNALDMPTSIFGSNAPLKR
jgi:hypothetical protein